MATTSKPSATRRRNRFQPTPAEHRGIATVIAPARWSSDMANDNTARDTDHVWDLMKKIGFAMLVTHDGDKLRARPMSAYLERENNAVYFLTDARRHKDDEIARNPNVNLSFADASDQNYVSVTGTAVVSNDRAKIKQLFSTPGEGMVGLGRRPQHPRAEIHARRCRVLGFARHRHQLCEDGGRGRHRHPSRNRRQPQGGDVDGNRSSSRIRRSSRDNRPSRRRKARREIRSLTCRRRCGSPARRRGRRSCRGKLPRSCQCEDRQPRPIPRLPIRVRSPM